MASSWRSSVGAIPAGGWILARTIACDGGYLLDTCVLSELVKPAPDRGLIGWLEATDERRLYLSALTLGELAKGVARPASGERQRRLQTWLDEDLSRRFVGRILSVDRHVALRWGELQAQAERRGRPMPVIDALLAATAAVHALTVVTRNGGDMAESGVTTVNPWSP